jgi:hypothetical protein
MMNSNTNCKKTKKLTLEKYFTGELASPEAAELESHVQGCTECNAYMESLEERKRRFHGAYPFGTFIDAVKERSTPWYMKIVERINQPVLRPVYAMVLLLCIALPLYISYNNQPQIRMKGRDDISFLYRRNGVVNEGDIKDTFHADDEIQILYTSTASQYITLFSIDTEREISFYHPDYSSRWCSIATGAGAGQHYPSSIVLDSTPGQELIVAVFTRKPVSTESIERRVDRIINKEPLDLSGMKKHIESDRFVKNGKAVTLMLNKR